MEHYKNREELIPKFKDGDKRYLESALFNKVVQMLIRGADPILIIDQLVEMNDETQKKFQEYMINAPMPTRIGD